MRTFVVTAMAALFAVPVVQAETLEERRQAFKEKRAERRAQWQERQENRTNTFTSVISDIASGWSRLNNKSI